ncbi:MAG: hypothetical protein P4L03_03455 [Terracidiphilus sp.]|nr:hypothetical protein [Terracidiphilus sp.]
MKREPKKRADIDGPDAEESLEQHVDTAVERIAKLPPDEMRKRTATMRAVEHLLANPPRASDYRGLSIEQAVSRSAEIYSNALAEELVKADFDKTYTGEYAAAIWRAHLPDLLDRPSAQQYVACVAWGMKFGLIDANQAKSMMYIAQNLLTVLRINIEAPIVPREPRRLESAPLFVEGQIERATGKDVG